MVNNLKSAFSALYQGLIDKMKLVFVPSIDLSSLGSGNSVVRYTYHGTDSTFDFSSWSSFFAKIRFVVMCAAVSYSIKMITKTWGEV